MVCPYFVGKPYKTIEYLERMRFPMIKDFGFIIPQNCQFGMGALKKLPDFLKAAGSDNVMLISDRGLEAIGVVDKVREIIKAADLKYSEYLDVLPNPTTSTVTSALPSTRPTAAPL